MHYRFHFKHTQLQAFRKFLSLITALVTIVSLFPARQAAQAQAAATLTVAPITWNIVGLDSNNVNVGPSNFPIGARVCNTGSGPAANVASAFVWDTSDAYIDLRPGSVASYSGATAAPSLAAGACTDFYYEISVARNASAYDHTRRYHITASADGVSPVSSVTPRELYVEHLVSQNRNAVTDVKLDGVSVPNGGTMNLKVGSTYNIQLIGSTATNGYNQLESFINLANTIFRVNSVTSTYGITSLTPPYNRLYADSCGWDANPLSPTYRSCVGSDGKTGGQVTANYNVTIIGGGGSSQTLNTLLYDFSGSSFHYNSDFSSSARMVSIVAPVSFAKAFSPASVAPGGTTTLTFALYNPTSAAVSGVSMSDPLPAAPGQMKVTGSPVVSLSNCGPAAYSAAANATTISLSGATIAAGATCTFSVSVTAPVNGAYANATDTLTINGVDTGLKATANLTVAATSTGTGLPCVNRTLAHWTMSSGVDANGFPAYASKASDVVAPTASFNTTTGGQVIDAANGNGTPPGAWAGYGWSKTGTPDVTKSTTTYYQIAVDTARYSAISISLDASANTNWGPNGNNLFVFSNNTDGTYSQLGASIALDNKVVWPSSPYTFNTTATGLATTYFRISAVGANNTGSNATLLLDNITVSGCGLPIQPTLDKTFAPTQIKEDGVSVLTFTLTNGNGTALTGAAFTDPLPGGLVVASVPGATNTCGATFNPAAGATSLTLTGGTIPANSQCTAQVNVTAAKRGAYTNTTGQISTAELGTNTGADGSDTAVLTVLAAPGFSKKFSPNPIYAGQTTTLTFTLTNPNSTPLTGAGFTDDLPAGVSVAQVPAAGTTCAGATFAPAQYATSLTFSGGAIPANGSCTAQVNVTANAIGEYPNTSSVLNAAPASLSAPAAKDSLFVITHYPGLKLSKEVSTGASGPWTNFVTTAPGSSVYYRLTVENIGDVDLTSVQVADPALALTGCALAAPATLTTLNPIASCTVGPVSAAAGDTLNTATAAGSYGGASYTSMDTAEYVGVTTVAAPALSLVKQVGPAASGPWASSLTGVDAGAGLYYKFTVVNPGNAPLSGLSISDPQISTAGCQLIDPLAPGAATACVVGPVTAAAGTHSNTAAAISAAPAVTSPSSTAAYTVGAYAIGGTVWVDANGDTIVDSGETRLPGAILKLYQDDNNSGTIDAGDTYLGTTYAAADGSYAFTDLPAGNYLVQVTGGVSAYTLAAGWSNPRPVSLTTTSVTGKDFGYQVPPIDLGVSKDNGVAALNAGAATTYTIRVTNYGPSSVTGAVLTDTVLSGLTLTGAACTGGNRCVSDPDTTALAGVIALPALAKDEFYEIRVTAAVGADATSASNKATVAPPTGMTDGTPGNNSQTDTDPVTPIADLGVVKDDGVGTVDAGGTTTYTITVTNHGPSSVSGAKLTDTVLSGLTLTGAACVSGNTCVSDPDYTLLANGITLPALAKDATYQIKVTAKADADAATASNKATIAPLAGTTDGTPGNDASTDTDTIKPAADLEVTKDNAADDVTAGGTTTYTIRVTNHGPSSVTGAVLKDTVLSGLSLSGAACTGGNRCASDPDYRDLAGGITLPALAKDEYYEIQVTANVTAASGSVSNQAVIAPPTGATDGNDGNNSDTDTDPVTPAPVPTTDLGVSKSNAPGNVDAGGTTTYTITVTNHGAATVSGATLTDTVLSGLSLTGAICSGTLDNTCTADPDYASLAGGITLPDLPKDAFYEILVTAKVTAASGTVSNQAAIAPPPGTTDDTPGNDTSTDTDTVTPAPLPNADLDIVKDNGVGTVDAGSSTTYTITVTNHGPDTVTGAKLTDTVLSGLTITGAACVGGNTCVSDPDYTALANGITLPELAKGASYAIRVTAKVDANAAAASNKATIVPPTGTTDSTPGNDTSTDTGAINPLADLGVTKDNAATRVDAGGTTTYTITVTNYGPSSVTGATLTDTVLSGLTLTGAACVSGNTCVSDPDYTALASGIALPALAKDATYQIMVTAKVDANATSASNMAAIDPPAGVTDGNASNDSATDTDAIDPVADLGVTKDNAATAIDAGGTTTYTITVTNYGPSSVTGATLTDTVLGGLNLTGVSCVSGSKCVSDPDAAALSSGITLPTLAKGETYTIRVTASVTAASGSASNQAVIAVPTGTKDETPGNNTGTDTDTINPAPAPSADLSVFKTNVAGPINAGGTATYTITVTNHGPDPVTGAKLTDTVLSGLTLTGAACAGGTGNQCIANPDYTALASGMTLPALAKDAFYAIRVTANVSAAATAAINKATIAPPTGTTDPDGTNDSSTDTDSITPVADLGVTKDDGVGAVDAGGSTTYTITVTNHGPSSVTGATLTDTVLSGLTLTGAACASVGGNKCAEAPDYAALPGGISLPALAKDDFYAITVTASVTAPSGSASNQAAVAPPTGTTDGTPGNDTSTDTNTVTPAPVPSADLGVVKDNGVSTVDAGGSTSYTITVTNHGPDTVTGAKLTDTVLNGLAITGAACASTTANKCVASPVFTALPGGITLPALAKDEFYAIRVTADVTAASGSAINRAAIAPPPGTTDPVAGNDSSTDTDPVQTVKTDARVYLPFIRRSLTGTVTTNWDVTLGYEDLPLSLGRNDYDYNDWTVGVDSTFSYLQNDSERLLQSIDMSFVPRARGGAYDHQFQLTLPGKLLISSGKAVVTVYDQNHRVLNTQATPFAGGADTLLVIFRKTSDVFPGSLVDSVEGKTNAAPKQTAEVQILFDKPAPFTVDPAAISQPHGQGLFFDPGLNVLNTGETVHRGDTRLLSVPSTKWQWPEEGVRIDRAYPLVGYQAGNPPTFTFPDQWWTNSNHCVYDGVKCGTP